MRSVRRPALHRCRRRMSVANTELFEQSLQALQHIPLQAALVTDHEGVVLLRAGELADDASLQRMAANYAQTTEQNSAKLRLGKNRLVTAIYGVRRTNIARATPHYRAVA